MMGFGYLGGLSSSSPSPSNLSALAPPFTVDRSNTKPISSPLINVTEVPPYDVPFTSSLHSWQYPHSSAFKPDHFSGSEVESLQTSALQSANEYCYLGSESINSPGTHWASPDPNMVNPTSNPFSYSGGPKQYYPSYASQVVDDSASMVGLNQANHDLLSSSGLVPVVGSFHGDYSQGVSEVGLPPPTSGFWNGLSDGKLGRKTDADGSFHLEETEFPHPYAYLDDLKRGAIPVKCFRSEDTPTSTQRKYADVYGAEGNSGYLAMEQLDDKLEQNLGFRPIESINAPISQTSPIFSENHLESPSLEPVTFYSNRQESYSPYGKSFQLFDSCINDFTSVPVTSPMPVIRQPALVTKLPASDTISSKSIGVGDVAVAKKKDLSSYNQSIEKEPLLPPRSEGKEIYLDGNHLSFHIGRNDQHIYASTSLEEMSTKPLSGNVLDNTVKVRGSQVSDINSPHGFTFSTEAFKHAVNSKESLDYHNPAEDSPCWKGAPSSNISPFETSDVIPPQILMKKLEAISLNFQVPQMFPSNNDSVIDLSHEKSGPNLQKESLPTDSITSVPPMNHLRVDVPAKKSAARSKSDSRQLVTSDGDQYSDNVRNPIKEYDLLNVSTNDFVSIQSQNKQLYPEELNFTSKSKIQFEPVAVDDGISSSDTDTSEDGCIPLHAVENVLCSPPSEEDVGKPHATGFCPKMNIQTLVKTLHNLSELVLLYSSDDGWLLKEHDCKTLQHAISNINSCLSKKSVQSTPGQESRIPKADIADILAEGSTKVGPHAKNEIGIATHGQLDSYSIHEVKRKCGVFDKNFEENMDVASSRNDAHTMRHHNVVQKIKNVLNESCPLEEDISSKTLLYKNLWLDAEAELSLTVLKSRVDRVKIQMENCKSDEAIEKSIVVEKVPSSTMSPDPDLDVPSGLTPEANGIPKQKASVDFSLITSPKSHVNDVEGSVMARFQILKCRGDNSCNVEENPRPDAVQPDGTDFGAPRQIVGSQSGNKGFDVAVESRVQCHTSNEKKSGSSLDDSQQETTEVRVHNQLASASGWYENSSSDWEHVVKDDFA